MPGDVIKKTYLLLLSGCVLAAATVVLLRSPSNDPDSLSVPFRSGYFSIDLSKQDLRCYYATVPQLDGSQLRFFLSSSQDYMLLKNSSIHLIVIKDQYALAYIHCNNIKYVFFMFDAYNSIAYTGSTNDCNKHMITKIDAIIRVDCNDVIYTDMSLALCKIYNICQ